MFLPHPWTHFISQPDKTVATHTLALSLLGEHLRTAGHLLEGRVPGQQHRPHLHNAVVGRHPDLVGVQSGIEAVHLTRHMVRPCWTSLPDEENERPVLPTVRYLCIALRMIVEHHLNSKRRVLTSSNPLALYTTAAQPFLAI